mgnify:CR=1 FL=1
MRMAITMSHPVWVRGLKPKVIDLYEHTGWCISLDGVNPCELLDSEVCQGSVIGSVYDNPELLKGGNHESNI